MYYFEVFLKSSLLCDTSYLSTLCFHSNHKVPVTQSLDSPISRQHLLKAAWCDGKQ